MNNNKNTPFNPNNGHDNFKNQNNQPVHMSPDYNANSAGIPLKNEDIKKNPHKPADNYAAKTQQLNISPENNGITPPLMNNGGIPPHGNIPPQNFNNGMNPPPPMNNGGIPPHGNIPPQNFNNGMNPPPMNNGGIPPRGNIPPQNFNNGMNPPPPVKNGGNPPHGNIPPQNFNNGMNPPPHMNNGGIPPRGNIPPQNFNNGMNPPPHMKNGGIPPHGNIPPQNFNNGMNPPPPVKNGGIPPHGNIPPQNFNNGMNPPPSAKNGGNPPHGNVPSQNYNNGMNPPPPIKNESKNPKNVVSGVENNSNEKDKNKSRKKLIIITVSVAGALIVIGTLLVLTFIFHIWGNHKWQEATCETPKTCISCHHTEGEPLGHQWSKATCTAAKKCTVCEKIEGKPLGHSWKDATCETPETCSLCGETKGKALGHDWPEIKDCEKSYSCKRCGEKTGKGEHTWVKATCEKPKTCSVCGKTSGKAKGHDWEEATCQHPKTCKVCKKTEGKVGEHKWTEATLDSPKKCSVCGKTEGKALDYYSIGVGIILTDDASGLNLRKEPRQKSDKIISMSEGRPVIVYSCNIPKWYYVEYDGKYGYASEEFITLIDESYYSDYHSNKLIKVISADIDNDKTFEAVAFFENNNIIVYEKGGKNTSYEDISDESYDYHLVNDKNTGKYYLAAEKGANDDNYREFLSIYPDVKKVVYFDPYTKGQTLAKYLEYLKKVEFLEETCESNSDYSTDHWLNDSSDETKVYIKTYTP